jgi:hypothetical protein
VLTQPLLDHLAGINAYVDANPLSPKIVGGMDRGAATAERVQHHVASVAAGSQDAIQ